MKLFKSKKTVVLLFPHPALILNMETEFTFQDNKVYFNGQLLRKISAESFETISFTDHNGNSVKEGILLKYNFQVLHFSSRPPFFMTKH